MKPAPSLRRTLLMWLLVPMLLLAPAAAAFQYSLVWQPAMRAFDQSLGNSVISIANFVQTDAQGVQFKMSAQTERSIRTVQNDTIFYVVMGPDGGLLAGDPPLAEPQRVLGANEWAFYDATLFGQAVRVGALGVACGSGTRNDVCQVRVAETRKARDSLRTDMLTAFALGLLVFAGASTFLVVMATARGLQPLQRLSQQLGARSLGDLRPLQAGAVPAEAVPVVEAMNRLLERVQAGSSAQQAFLADAAHQLRTPLATLKAEAELALMQAHPPHLNTTLQRINAAAARAARLGSQMLALARSDASARDALPVEPIDLKRIAADLVDEWLARANAAGIDLGFELQAAPLHGQALLLREALANLLHNAVTYAGPGAHVTLRTFAENQAAVLEVEDDGPGIAAHDRARVLQRFQRGAQTDQEGSGLGLAIVNDVVVAHAGTLSMSECQNARRGGPGLCVRISFPARGAS